jgi:hypothetical protein
MVGMTLGFVGLDPIWGDLRFTFGNVTLMSGVRYRYSCRIYRYCFDVQLKDKPMNDPQAVYDKVKQEYKNQKKSTWLKPFGFNNTYSLTMRAEDA